MTIRHIVLFAFKPSLSQIEIQKIMTTLEELKKNIPQILSFSWGENNSPENLHQGYLHGFVMEFKNETDRNLYVNHPLHIKVASECVFPALIAGSFPIVFDYAV